jgi:DNA polymerase (family X)
MRKEIPAGVLEMLAVPGLRPEKVLKLYKTLGITCSPIWNGQAKILRSLAIARRGEGRLHMHGAAILLENAERSLQQAHPDLKRITESALAPARVDPSEHVLVERSWMIRIRGPGDH